MSDSSPHSTLASDFVTVRRALRASNYQTGSGQDHEWLAAPDALNRIQEQLETAHAATEDTALAANLFREQRDRLQEQLETLREALEWCNDHRDSERFYSVAESALNRVSSPASELHVEEDGSGTALPPITADPRGLEPIPFIAGPRPAAPTPGEGSVSKQDRDPASNPNGEQTREQLLERLALTVREAIDGGSFDGTLFESQVSGTLWLLYGEQSPAIRPEDDPLSPRGQFDGVIVVDSNQEREP